MAARQEIDELVSTIQSLKNKTLMSICVQNRLAKSGNKADLQKRIINLIDSAVQDPNPQKFQNIRSIILNSASESSPNNYRVYYSSSSLTSSPSFHNHTGMASPYNNGHGSSTVNGSRQGISGYGNGADANRGSHGLQFKSSPFYEIETRLGDVRQCEAMTQHRNSIPISIRATTYPELQRCLSDTSLRVMIFCAAANLGVQDIAFPYQCELKVNGGDVKANLRGLKNKPGSTLPVDITHLLRLKPPNYTNTLEFTYALTSKKYYVAIYMCKTRSATSLASSIERRARITKASVLRELAKQAQDTDIVTTSLVISLKCPLSYMRLSLPIRATTCKHIQCFDATSYLQLQEQGPQWMCPICSKPAPFESLAVDEYVREILANSGDQEQATIDPDGTWHSELASDGVVVSTPKAEASFLDDDDDDKALAAAASIPLPSSAGRDTLATVGSRDTTATPGHAGSKRPHEVIDLTLSDSDDDDGGGTPTNPPPFKRQNTASGFSPLHFPSI